MGPCVSLPYLASTGVAVLNRDEALRPGSVDFDPVRLTISQDRPRCRRPDRLPLPARAGDTKSQEGQ